MSFNALGSIVTSQKTHGPVERSENSTIPTQINTAESTIVFRKNHTVPRTTHDTLSQSVIGVIKNKSTAMSFDVQRSDPRFSTIQFQKNAVRVISGKTNVIS